MDRAALFDVDGTLTDTNHLHITSWWEALRQAGHHVPMHAVHRAIGLPGEDLLDHLLGEDRDHSGDARLSAAHDTLYATYFDRLTAFDSSADVLRALSEDGWKVVLVTSAKDRELDALRKAIGADDAITDTATSDDVDRGKPAPDPVRHALELVGVSPDRAVFIGDSVWDMKAADRAGVAAVGLLCGGIPGDDLVEAGAVAVYRDPADLLAGLGDSPLSRVPALKPLDAVSGMIAGMPRVPQRHAVTASDGGRTGQAVGMNESLANVSSSYYVTVRGERFTCGGVTGLGPQGDLGLPGQVLTLTLDDCVLTDAPGAQEWALSTEAPAEPCNVKIEEMRAGSGDPLTTWYLTDARPDSITDHSTTATSHETRIGRLTMHAAKISPDMP